MRLVCAIVLQLMSFYAFAGSTSTSLLVTVTVVRPAPVTSTLDVGNATAPIARDAQSKPVTGSAMTDGVRCITINY